MPSPASEDSLLINWQTQIRKGLLELCILNLLRGSRMYGYDLVKRLAGVPGLLVSEGTIYPLLARLRRAGWVRCELVESDAGPARKYYRLTAAGRDAVHWMNLCWGSLAEAVRERIGEPEAPDTGTTQQTVSQTPRGASHE